MGVPVTNLVQIYHVHFVYKHGFYGEDVFSFCGCGLTFIVNWKIVVTFVDWQFAAHQDMTGKILESCLHVNFSLLKKTHPSTRQETFFLFFTSSRNS